MTNDIIILIVIYQSNIQTLTIYKEFEYHRNVEHEVNYKRSYKLEYILKYILYT